LKLFGFLSRLLYYFFLYSVGKVLQAFSALAVTRPGLRLLSPQTHTSTGNPLTQHSPANRRAASPSTTTIYLLVVI
jgi:hypothetical protein